MTDTHHARRGTVRGETPGGRRLSENEVHELLRNERRRAVLRIIRDGSDSVPVRDLAERIAAEETGTEPAPRSDRQSVYISLIQTHLPKLDDASVIDYDDQHKTITPGPATDQLVTQMETCARSADTASPSGTRPRRELVVLAAVSVLGSLLAAASAVGTPVVSELVPALWSLLAIAAVLAVVGYYQA